jgi:hypothetical protein
LNYQTRLESLWQRQPEELSDIETIILIDKLTCYELKTLLDFKEPLNLGWFWDLCVMLTELYLLLLDSPAWLLSSPDYKEVIISHSWALQNSKALADPKTQALILTEYLSLRASIQNLISDQVCVD